MYHVSAQGVDERMINVHYYYSLSKTYRGILCRKSQKRNGPLSKRKKTERTTGLGRETKEEIEK